MAGRQLRRLEAAVQAVQAYLDGSSNRWPTSSLRVLNEADVIGRREGIDDEAAFRARHRDAISELVTRLTRKGQQWAGTVASGKGFKEAVLHQPDQIAGGYFELPGPDDLAPVVLADDGSNLADFEAYLTRLRRFVGTGAINSSIGGRWPTKVSGLFTAVQSAFPDAEARPLFTMNVQLTCEGA